MIDEQARARLRTSLAQLIEGQLTNDEFDQVYWEMAESADLGVAEIALFGWGLYSSDLLWPYRLTGINAIDQENRRISERCLAFLETDLEFRWPRLVSHTGRWYLIHLLATCIAAPGYLFGLMALILSCVVSTHGLWAALVGLGLLGYGFVISWLGYKYERRKEEHEWKEYCRTGDWKAWPFLTADEYRAAVPCRT